MTHAVEGLQSRGTVEEMVLEPGTLHVVVVSPARPVSEGPAKYVVIEAVGGQLGIAPQHADLVAALGAGPLRIVKEDGSTDRFAVCGGFLKVGKNKVTILVDEIVRPDEVNEVATRGELEKTLEALRHPKSDDEFTDLLTRRAWCQSRLNLRA